VVRWLDVSAAVGRDDMVDVAGLASDARWVTLTVTATGGAGLARSAERPKQPSRLLSRSGEVIIKRPALDGAL